VTVHTHALSRVAGDIFDSLTRKLGAVNASVWMLSASPYLGGRSAVQAIKDGDADAVRALVDDIGKVKADA
jgi:hypothetical protein